MPGYDVARKDDVVDLRKEAWSMPSFCASTFNQWLTRCHAMSVPNSFDKSAGRAPRPSLSLALCGLCRSGLSGEEPTECSARPALAGRCLGDMLDAGGCGLVCRSRDRAFCSVSSVFACKFIGGQLNPSRREVNAQHLRAPSSFFISLQPAAAVCNGCRTGLAQPPTRKNRAENVNSSREERPN
jgi:hypothetical protein